MYSELIDLYKLCILWEEEEEGGVWLCVARPVMGGAESFGATTSEAVRNWVKRNVDNG